MEAIRAVVCWNSRKAKPRFVLKLVATNRSGCEHPVRRRCRAVAIALALQSLLLYGVLPARAQSEKPTGEVKRPALQIGSALRFNEDWSTLEGVDTTTTDDFWDRLKFIPLTADQSVWLASAARPGRGWNTSIISSSAPRRPSARIYISCRGSG
jgi:hypothetical protein